MRLFAAVSAVTLGLLTWATEAQSQVVCGVRNRAGGYQCTYFCQNGFICDNANMRCLPGPEIKKQLSKLQEDARIAKRKSNEVRASSEAETSKKLIGNGLGRTYSGWNGNPRIVPTPQHDRGGYLPSTFAQRTSAAANVRSGTLSVRRSLQPQLLALVTAARSFSATDPNRAGAVKLLRDFARKNRLNIDVDELLTCDVREWEDLDKGKAFKLRWDVPAVEAEARKLCGHLQSDEERDACAGYEFGQVVMRVEPELKALCKLQEDDPQETDTAALGDCAERKFKSSLANRDGWVPLTAKGRALAVAENCPKVEDPIDAIRKRIRKAIDDMPDTYQGEATSADDRPPPSPTENTKAPPVPIPDMTNSDDDDPFCAFIARKSVRGELTPGAGAVMPDYCRKAVDAAKACEEQKCSMADIIEREERERGRVFPWGSEDYEAIARVPDTLGPFK